MVYINIFATASYRLLLYICIFFTFSSCGERNKEKVFSYDSPSPDSVNGQNFYDDYWIRNLQLDRSTGLMNFVIYHVYSHVNEVGSNQYFYFLNLKTLKATYIFNTSSSAEIMNITCTEKADQICKGSSLRDKITNNGNLFIRIGRVTVNSKDYSNDYDLVYLKTPFALSYERSNEVLLLIDTPQKSKPVAYFYNRIFINGANVNLDNVPLYARLPELESFYQSHCQIKNTSSLLLGEYDYECTFTHKINASEELRSWRIKVEI